MTIVGYSSEILGSLEITNPGVMYLGLIPEVA